MLRGATVGRVEHVDVVVRDGTVVAVGTDLVTPDMDVIEASGCTVLPGLHDHHCHLLATAAARASVACGPPNVRDALDLAAALGSIRPQVGWVRGVGYHESVAGDLDRRSLDAARDDVPVRVQHRGGSLWVVNSAGLTALGLGGRAEEEPAGVERDEYGIPTGRLWRCDDWLRARLGPRPAPDLAAVSEELAAYGITGVTDATPDLDAEAISLLRSSAVQQRLTLLGDSTSTAPRKIVVSDHALPGPDELAATVAATRPRPVAVHCVTRTALVLTIVALRQVGAMPGDRVEHAAVVPTDVASDLAELGVTVVTQPSMAALRGDHYLNDVDAGDREFLWPFASLLAAGVEVGCSSDAPYGSSDPWFATAAATQRRTSSGRPIAAAERVTAAQALHGWLTAPLAPGGPARRVVPGVPADLVVLDAPLADVLADPAARHVRLTLIGGEVAYGG